MNNISVTPLLSRITIYPIKGLDGIELQTAMITTGGCLLNDRAYAMVDLDGQFIVGKSNPLVHLLRTKFDLENELVSFRHQEKTEWKQFHLQKEKKQIEIFLSDFFKIAVTLVEDKTGQFLDIPDISGATVLSTESLKSVCNWFGNLNLDETRKRFRATLEIEGVPAFWEDHLFSKPGTAIEFKIGDVTLFGMSPRERCVVPTRNPLTGEVLHAFPKTFSKHRAIDLPPWSTLEENYKHYYYLSVDCYLPETEVGKWINTGDELKIIGKKIFY